MVALGLTGLSAVIAMVARAPLSRPTPIDARSTAAPVAALFLLVIGAGVLGLTALVVALWPGRRHRVEEEPGLVYEGPQIHWVWKLVAILLPFALGAALIAAVVVGVTTANGTSAVPGGGPAPTPVPRSTSALRASAPANGFTLPMWLPWTILGIVVLAAAAGVWLVGTGRRERVARDAPDRTPAQAAVRAAMAALDTVEDPRKAVIAAYAGMQDSLAGHGVARQPAEAPREYLRRVLATGTASEQELTTLTGLFEEARFSPHPISERVRERALVALSSLRAALG